MRTHLFGILFYGLTISPSYKHKTAALLSWLPFCVVVFQRNPSNCLDGIWESR